LTGFIIGLGAVTVIDLHGFLGIKSKYWTEATTRTHKVTKPMIWVGILLIIIGEIIFFRNDSSNILIYLLAISIILIINGIFLSFSVSPYMIQREKEGRQAELLPKSWQNKIMISLLFSDLGWWSSLVMIIWYLVSI
jgi:multisubunit Na+/H+ antiporter MnhG subunit